MHSTASHLRTALVHPVYTEWSQWLPDLVKTADATPLSTLTQRHFDEFRPHSGPQA